MNPEKRQRLELIEAFLAVRGSEYAMSQFSVAEVTRGNLPRPRRDDANTTITLTFDRPLELGERGVEVFNGNFARSIPPRDDSAVGADIDIAIAFAQQVGEFGRATTISQDIGQVPELIGKNGQITAMRFDLSEADIIDFSNAIELSLRREIQPVEHDNLLAHLRADRS
ncbi:MAG: hypothetical protein ACPGRX_05880 [Bdellovibrionales bacterium]